MEESRMDEMTNIEEEMNTEVSENETEGSMDTENEQETEVKRTNPAAKWYVVHTYSGYENKVMSSLNKTIENRNLGDLILEVRIPIQEVEETGKNGVTKTVQHKMFPGYVLVHMVQNEDTWYIVRNTRGVTGFVGPEGTPVALTETEMANLGIISSNFEVAFKEGDFITVVKGAWANTQAKVVAVDAKRQTVTINVELFGRVNPVEIGFDCVRKM